MAVVTTALALTRDYVPYERPPQPQTLWTAIPRGLQSGILNAGVLDAKPINDTQRLTITMTLPSNFGYVMADASMTLVQDLAQNWNTHMCVEFTNFFRGAGGNVTNLVLQYRQALSDCVLNGTTSVGMDVQQPWPTFPIISPASDMPTIIVFRASNNVATAAAAGTVSAFISFWQFDLEQIRKFPINSPQPVHAR